MIQGIAYIVCHDLFDLKLIGPYINRLLRLKDHIGLFLSDHDIHGLEYTTDQGYDIKPLHHNCIFAGFQLVQGKKIFYQFIHLGSFIHNDIAVELSALRVIGNVFFQTFCVALDQSDGSFQLMRYVIQKFFSHLVDLDLVLNVPLQFIVCGFQFTDGGLKL